MNGIMDLYLIGHDYKYAAEQILLTMYPQQRPVYPETVREGDRAELELRPQEAVCRLWLEGACYEGRESVAAWTDELEKVRLEQRAVKMSFYRAALAAGHTRPAWGALTGVKPGKLMAQFLQAGKTAEDFAAEFDVSEDRTALCLETARATLAAKDSLQPGDICLYVGIPFCPTRCAYCSFISSAVGRNLKLMEPYLEALLGEIERTGAMVKAAGQRPVALYFGGGTPTTLSAEQLDVLCGKMAECFDLSALREYTVEAGRPDTITAEKLQVLKKHGVTRLSVNPQTMSDEVLEAIGRFHTAEDIRRALALVREAGDFEVNMDLIAGLPKDSPEGFAATMDAVLALEPENVTVHTLSMKNGSRLSEHPEVLPTAEEVAVMLDRAGGELRRAGYAPYYLYRQKYISGGFENVGWAKGGTVNLYNIAMMEELCEVVAMGAGASTKMPDEKGGVHRRINPKFPKEYIERMKQYSQT